MNLFKKDQRVALYIEKKDIVVEIICTINKILDDRLILNLPQYFMRYIDIMQVGTKLMAKVFSKLGTIDFNSIIISSPLEDSFAIELDYNAIKFVDNADLTVIEEIHPLKINDNTEEITAETIEISTQNLKFTYQENKFKLNQILDFTLHLPKNYDIINFKGIISHIDEIYENEYTVTYSIISDVARQNLLYYIYMKNMN
ncbi:hypothetical protein IJO12_08315 [bacterium]|nr:hypothetical protein [bacterium]